MKIKQSKNFKVKRLKQEIELMNRRLEEAVTILTALIHREGGEVTVTRAEIENLPVTRFLLSPQEDGVKITLEYESGNIKEESESGRDNSGIQEEAGQ